MLLIRAVEYNSLVSYLLAKEEAKTPLSSPLWDGQWRLLFYSPLEEGVCEPILVTAPTSIGRCCDLYRSA